MLTTLFLDMVHASLSKSEEMITKESHPYNKKYTTEIVSKKEFDKFPRTYMNLADHSHQIVVKDDKGIVHFAFGGWWFSPESEADTGL